MKNTLGFVIAILLLLAVGMWLLGEWAETRCEAAGGRVVSVNGVQEICADEDGRIIREW